MNDWIVILASVTGLLLTGFAAGYMVGHGVALSEGFRQGYQAARRFNGRGSNV